jgi:hypothetical protein
MFEEQIARGMEALDDYFGAEDWVNAVDPSNFKMDSCDACVVGQLIGWSAVPQILPELDRLEPDNDEFFDDEQEIIAEHGFDLTPQMHTAIMTRARITRRHRHQLADLAWRRLEKEWLDAIKARLNKGVKV